MPHFKLALGYRTEHRHSEPVILAASYDVTALQAAIDAAPPEMLRTEIGTFAFLRKGRRSIPDASSSHPGLVGHETPAPEPENSGAASGGPAVAESEDGPTLAAPVEGARTRRR